MPLVDLCSENGKGLRPDARAKVYAIMMHPDDRQARRRILDTARKDTAGHISLGVFDPALVDAKWAAQIGLSGAILLTLIRLDMAGYRASLNTASLLISEMWDDEPAAWDDPDYNVRGLETGRQKARHLRAWNDYRSVAHLWAAYLLSDMDGPSFTSSFAPSFLGKNSDLVGFLQAAEGLAIEGSKILLDNPQRRRRTPAIEKTKAYRFKLPGAPPPVCRSPVIPTLTDFEKEILGKYPHIHSRPAKTMIAH